jgi:NitT/TauT family transport system ATP-binding protein
MSSPPAPILSIVDVSKRYETADGELLALDRISFDVGRGEIITVIGPSGCGKTTLFNIVGGLIDGDDGKVLVDGKGRASRRQIGMVFQEESNFPWRTTLQNVALPLEAAGMGRAERLERARHFVRLVGLEGFENRYPDELSGGMRQRAALARTLAFEPQILLMDEPFAALDSQTRLLIGDKVLQIRQALDQTMLLITHNLTEAVQLSDRVVVLTRRPAACGGSSRSTCRARAPRRSSAAPSSRISSGSSGTSCARKPRRQRRTPGRQRPVTAARPKHGTGPDPRTDTESADSAHAALPGALRLGDREGEDRGTGALEVAAETLIAKTRMAAV